MTEPWPTAWPPADELYATTSADLDDITSAGVLVAQAGIDVDWRDLARTPYSWTALLRAAVHTANAFAQLERDPEWDLPAQDGMPAVEVWRIVDEDGQ